MKYLNFETVSSFVLSLFVVLVLYYFNRNDETKIPLKTYVKTFLSTLAAVFGMFFIKKKLGSNLNLNMGSSVATPSVDSGYQTGLNIEEPNF